MTDIIALLTAYLRGMWRFRWWALAGSWLLCMAGFAWVYMLPNVFESSTQVYVDTKTALRDVMRGIATSNNVQEEVQKKLSEMISAPELKKVARETDLDIRATTPRQMEKLIENLRRTIQIQNVRRNQSLYSITYRDKDPAMAQRVVQTMLNNFVGESLRENTQDSDNAIRFLEDQIRLYDNRLLKAEQELADFKKSHVGMMPGEGGDYYQRLETAMRRLDALRSEYRLKVRSRDELQRQIAGEEPTFGLEPDFGSGGFDGVSSVDAQIGALEGRLAEQLLQLTEKHPDVIATRATLETLQKQREDELSARAAIIPDRPNFNPLDQNPVYQAMKIQQGQVNVEIAAAESQISEQRSVVANLRRLVDTVPEVEAQLKRLNRDYAVTKSYHDDLLDKLESARLGEDADRESDEIKFQVIEPPLLPLEPTGPNRPLFLTAILMASLMFGIAIAFLLDQLRPVFSTRDELRKRTGLPVLGTISVVLMPHQKFITRVQTAGFAIGLLALVGMYFGAVMMEEQFVQIANSLHNRGTL